MSKRVRVSLTIPEDLNSDLESISRCTGISKSALVSELLVDRVTDIHLLLLNDDRFNGGGGTTKRMRGDSARSIRSSLSSIMDYLGLGGGSDGSSVH
jgi:hypothetical protein